MDRSTTSLIILGLVLQTSVAVADQYRTSNPASAYPPGCITAPLRDFDLRADHVAQFYSERVWLEVVQKVESEDPAANLGEVQLDMYRVGCSEPGRSVIVAEFSLPPAGVDLRKAQLVLPWPGGNTGFDPYPLVWRQEANSWGMNLGQLPFTSMTFGDYTGGWDDARRFTWRYVLDVPPSEHIRDWVDAPQYYNGEFAVLFYASNGEYLFDVEVPATEAVIEATSSLPLSGRLSGTWVEEGSTHQGLLISFSAAPASNDSIDSAARSPLVVFLSWFTFDAEGDPLWLTGAAELSQGTSNIEVPIEVVREGEFLGNAPAQRSTVGTARLHARQCNRIEFEYDLDALGLGSDVMQLQRLFALEIADFQCRDYRGLQSSIYSPEAE